MKSLRLRLFLGTALLLLLFSVLMGYALNNALNSYTVEAQKNQLESIVYRLLAVVEVDHTGKLHVDEKNLQIPGINQPDSTLSINITDTYGTPLWQSDNNGSNHIPATTNKTPPAVGKWKFNSQKNINQLDFGFEWSTNENQIYHYGLSVFETSGQLQKQQQQFSRKLFLWLLAFSAVMLCGFILFLGWTLSPLKKIRRELDSVQQGELNNLSSDFPSEIQPLSNKINQLIKHEQKQKQRYRNAIDDMAHSLKTPLAVMQGTAGRESDPELKEQLSRIESIINHQLSRAATAGKQHQLQPVLLYPIANRIIASLEKVYFDRNLIFDNHIHEDISIRMDKSDLLEVLGNLLDNAAKYGKQKVIIKSKQDKTGTRLFIEDDGDGITTSQRHNILNRGVRADEKQAGQGIGLAMTLDIIQAYDGRLTLTSSNMGGLQVTINIPV